MDGLKDWIFPSTRVGDAIRFRPLALEILYRGRLNPWNCLDMSLEELCRREGFSLPEFLSELAGLPLLDAGSDWEHLPVHNLIDYLTDEHRIFVHSDLPAIRTRLDMPYEGTVRPGMAGEPTQTVAPLPERDQDLFRRMTRSFHEFADLLRAHLQEEEETIFPAILRNEYRLRHPGRDAAAHPKIEVADRLLDKEAELVRSLDFWLDRVRSSRPGSGQPEPLEPAVLLMMAMAERLAAHGRREREILYPMARRIEERLEALVPAGG